MTSCACKNHVSRLLNPLETKRGYCHFFQLGRDEDRWLTREQMQHPRNSTKRRTILLWASMWRQEILGQLTQQCVGGGSEIPEIPLKNETKLLSVRVVKHRNGFPRGSVGHTPLETDKTPPEQQPALAGEGGRTRWFANIRSKPLPCCDSVKGKLSKQGHGQKIMLLVFGNRFWRNHVDIPKKPSPFPLFQLVCPPSLQYTPSVLAQERRQKGNPMA